jgi:F420-dependent oxidoreductase-like protein
MQALTVAAATGNRFVLGIGLSHQIVIEGSYGMSYAKPIRHMRDYLEILLPAVRGERVAYEGSDLTGRVFSPMKVPGAEPPPVVIAALGSQMLELAGSVADGTALWMVGPRTVADHIVPRLSAAADRAGRPRPRVVVGLPVSVTADVDAARDRAARTFAMYNTLPSYRAMLDREGVEGPSDVAVVGDEEAVASQLRHLAEIGATDLSLPVFGSRDDRERTLRLLAEIAEAS